MSQINEQSIEELFKKINKLAKFIDDREKEREEKERQTFLNLITTAVGLLKAQPKIDVSDKLNLYEDDETGSIASNASSDSKSFVTQDKKVSDNNSETSYISKQLDNSSDDSLDKKSFVTQDINDSDIDSTISSISTTLTDEQKIIKTLSVVAKKELGEDDNSSIISNLTDINSYVEEESLKSLIQISVSLLQKAKSGTSPPSVPTDKLKSLIQTSVSLLQKAKSGTSPPSAPTDKLKSLIQTSLLLLQKTKVGTPPSPPPPSAKATDKLKSLIQTSLLLLQKTKVGTPPSPPPPPKKDFVDDLNDKIVLYCRKELQQYKTTNTSKNIPNHLIVVSIITNGDEIVEIDPTNGSDKGALSKMDFRCFFKEEKPDANPATPTPLVVQTTENLFEEINIYVAYFEKGKIINFEKYDNNINAIKIT